MVLNGRSPDGLLMSPTMATAISCGSGAWSDAKNCSNYRQTFRVSKIKGRKPGHALHPMVRDCLLIGRLEMDLAQPIPNQFRGRLAHNAKLRRTPPAQICWRNKSAS